MFQSCFIKTYLKSIPNNNNDILGMDLVSLNESTPYISVSLANVTKKSVELGGFFVCLICGFFSKTGRTPE